MGLYSSEDEVVRDMFVLGLGIGVSMTLFNAIAQNAFLREIPLRKWQKAGARSHSPHS